MAASPLGGGTGIEPNKVAIYIRWSTDDQGDGTTLEVQRDACLHYARSQGWVVPDDRIFIDDGYSGGNLDRPGITKIRELVKKGEIQCVIVYKIDRLSRNIVNAVDLVLDEWAGRCYLKCVMEPIDTTTDLGRVIFSILATFADFERSQIRARTFSGKVKRAAQGKNPGGRVPYGYKIGPSPGEILIDEERAAIVRRIFNLNAEGFGARAIADILNREKITTEHGGTWAKSSVQKILTNPKYAGVWQFGRTRRNPNAKNGEGPLRMKSEEPLAEASRPDLAIVSVELWERCRTVRESLNDALRKTSGRALSSEHLLSGLVYCRCGHKMHIDVRDRPKRGLYIAYRCSGRSHKGVSYCDCGRIRERDLDALIEEIIPRLRSQEVIEIVKAQTTKKYQDQLAHIEEQLVRLDKRKRELLKQTEMVRRDYRAGKLDVDTFNSLRQEIAEEAKEIEANLQRSLAQRDYLREQLMSGSRLVDSYQRLNNWDQLTIAEKKALLRLIIRRITAYKKRNSHDPISVDIEFEGIDPEFLRSVLNPR